MVPSVRSRSLRDRMMIAAGRRLPLARAERLRVATYSSLPITMRAGPGVSSSAARAARESGPSVDARTTPPIAKAMSAPVSALNCAARRSSSSVPTLKRAEHVRAARGQA